MGSQKQDKKTLTVLFKKLKAHYKKHGYGVRKRKKGNPMWGTDPKRLKEKQEYLSDFLEFEPVLVVLTKAIN